MKRQAGGRGVHRRNSSSLAALSLLLTVAALPGLRAVAQGVTAPDLTVPLTKADVDPAVFAQWVGGSERPVLDEKGVPRPINDVIWTSADGGRPAWNGLVYGDSKIPGIRYLRIGFKNPVAIGSVLAHGGGQLSVLKPDAPYPGNLNDDSQWIPAQRLDDGRVVTGEVGEHEYALWTLPSVISTRALRFTHVSQPTDRIYGGYIAGISVLPRRMADLSPQAVATTRSRPEAAGRLNNGLADGWDSWDNITALTGQRPRTIADDPEWIMLTWPSPVTVGGLAALGSGFGAAEVQIYAGQADLHPGMATEADWKTVQSISGWKALYPCVLPVYWADLGRPVTTRAIRLRITAAVSEEGIHPHLQGKTNNGRRVWLDELIALKPLDAAGLESALLPASPPQVAAGKSHPPIPITFALPEDGFVTLVIDDSSGKRVRNLIADTPFPKGANTVYWDATDDLRRDLDAASHGLYNIPAELVAPGSYQARGLWHRQIDLNYEMSVYYPGNPPWPTQDGSGGWMTNHTPASSALFVPADKTPGGVPMLFIGSYVSEGGSALSWLDLNGNKLGGRGWIGGAWTGAQYLAYDNGANGVPGIYAYVGSTWKGDDPKPGEKPTGVIRLTGLAASGDKPVLQPVYTFDLTTEPDTARNMGGLAVHDGLLVFSQPTCNQLVFVDARAGRILGAAPLPNPRGLAFDAQGRLLALSGKSLLRYTPGRFPLPPPDTLVANLDQPAGLTLDGQGNIYVSDQGESNQVKVFASDGKPVRIYGKPGPSGAGPYDPDHMNSPKGIAVDSNGRLWVTEDTYQPKRVSVWDMDGTLWKAFYGPPRYGGGGALDSQDATRFSYAGMEFHIGWDKATSELKRVYLHDDDADILNSVFDSKPPEWTLHISGQRYMTNAFDSSETSGACVAFLFLDKGDKVVPVAAMGCANNWDLLKGDAFKPDWPPGFDLNKDRWGNNTGFIWSDLNGDGQVQPDEVKMWAGNVGGVTTAGDGSFLAANVTTQKSVHDGNAMRFRPVRFTEEGAPVYDFDKGEILAASQEPASDGGNQVLAGTEGWTVMTTPPRPFSSYGLGGAKQGVATWSYPSLWPGLHPSHNSPAADRPGELIGTTRLLGDFVTPRDSDAGPLFFINSNQGGVYVFTQDGLFVAELFHDVRQGPHWEMPTAQRGMLLNNLTLSDENFFPTVAQVPDGSIYLDTGDLSALVKVSGLESIHRIAPVPVSVSAEDLKLAQDFVTQREAARQAGEGSGILAVAVQNQAPSMDASTTDWANAQWAPIDRRGVAAYFNSESKPYDVQATVTFAAGKLFAFWKTGDPQLLSNSGAIENAPFKTGGALDLMIGSDPNASPDRTQPVAGDLRLLVTQVKGKTKAVLYRQVVPGTPDNQKVPFSAPWHSITFDSVIDVSDQVQLASGGTGNYEVAVPLNLLGLNPRAGMKIKGDIGILRGDGTQTTQRVYWNNKATAIVSDVPSEAMLTPGLWGIWEVH